MTPPSGPHGPSEPADGRDSFDDRQAADGRDPFVDRRAVEEFFAAHRERVGDEPADDATWQAIVRESRRGTVSRRSVRVLGVAASAAVIGLGAGVVWPQLTGDTPETIQASTPTDDAPSSDAPSSDGPTTGGPTSSDPTSSDPTSPTSVPAVPIPTGPVHRAGPAPATIPEGMPLVLVGAATTDQLYAYGQAYDGCASATGDCGLLAWSQDLGSTWVPAADLGGLGIGQLRFEGDAGWAWSTPGPTGEGTAAAQTDGVVLRSGDRGRTWREITHSGQDVLALELHTGQLVMVTGACDATTCTDLRVVQATSQATSMRLAVEMPLSGVEVAPGEVSVHFAGSTPFVVTGSAAAGLSIWRIPPGAAEPVRVAPPQDCATLSTFAAPPDADGVLYALCAVSTGAGGADAVQLYGSTTSGASWVPAGSPQPMDPSVGPGLGAGDAAHVVVLGSLGVQVSADGGGSWQVPEQPPLSTMTDAPVRFGEPGAAAVTAAADGTLLVRGAQFEGGQGGFWRSDDDGLTWTRVTVSTSAAP